MDWTKNFEWKQVGRKLDARWRSEPTLALNCPRLFQRWHTTRRAGWGDTLDVKFWLQCCGQILTSCLMLNFSFNVEVSKVRFQNFSLQKKNSQFFFQAYKYLIFMLRKNFCWISHLWLHNAGICRMNDVQGSASTLPLNPRYHIAVIPTPYPSFTTPGTSLATPAIVNEIAPTHWHTLGNYHM